MNQIGHNNPDMTETVGDVSRELSAWLGQHPVIENEDDAREGKKLSDRARLGLQDLEAERIGKVKPLNDKVAEINSGYRLPRETLRSILDELQFRLTDFIAREEAKRIKEAEEKRRIAEEAEAAARAAEIEEQKLIDAARVGELDLDVGQKIEETNKAFKDFKKAEREAVRAERDSRVKIGGGFGRAMSLRTQEILTVIDVQAAVKDIGATPAIIEAVISSAKAYRKMRGTLPSGVSSRTENKV